MMLQILPVDIEPQVIIRMHHLVRQGVLGVATIAEVVRAQQDAVLWREAASLHRIAREASDVGLVKLAVRLVDIFEHEADYGT